MALAADDKRGSQPATDLSIVVDHYPTEEVPATNLLEKMVCKLTINFT
jgi:hypothetical protein